MSPLPFRLTPPRPSPDSTGAAALDCGTVRPRLGRAPSEINPGPCGRPLGWSGGLLGGCLGLCCLGVLSGAALFPSSVLASAAQALATAGTGVLRGGHRRAFLVHSGRAVAPKKATLRRCAGFRPPGHAPDHGEPRGGPRGDAASPLMLGLARAPYRSRVVAAHGASSPADTGPRRPPRRHPRENRGRSPSPATIQPTCRSSSCPSRGPAAETCFLAVGRSFS